MQCILSVTPGTVLKIKVGLQNTVFNVSNNASAIYTGESWTSDYLVIAGGGYSYTDPNLCTNVVHTQGYQSGNDYITISMV